MNGGKWWKTLSGFLFFFLPTIVLVVAVAVLVYDRVWALTDGNVGWVVFALLCICLFFSVAAAIIEYFRHKWQVERRVQEILQGTERIAQGDFSVRFPITHEWGYYDDFDRIKENLNTLAKELSNTELVHSDFISSVSHEIKTPLTVINSYARMLVKVGDDWEVAARYAETLVKATERLSALVSNILKLNKLENGEVLPEFSQISAGQVLIETIFGMEALIEKKGLILETDIDETLRLSAPEGYWEILCGNLLSNAVKFTEPKGRVRVRLYGFGKELVFSVQDSGCGISAEAGKRIFDKFYQADTSRKSEGNGLGLALVKKVIQRMGGEISVESEVGKGSTFTVRLQRSV